ncbi:MULTISPECIES: hypothetical protein [Achromobacter]|uniref:Uncharacterized protein n=1 Tax=Achromobacter spanius TaxID=217203 RepID=A0ABY8GS14_9BURK|nr:MULTISPECIES: hypothetical protein [Achromobacter]WAI83180.1 hypothetical protein N8Z00_27420 [Achromobacter spanius]WEX93265.1 hypothetical protein N3Z32_22015 [Achromobacter sp. SS2-2022]WFP07577.1 hypothetical protein P8T11_25235 [Achromobacter spanius]
MTHKLKVSLGSRNLIDTLELLVPRGEVAHVDIELGEEYTAHPNSSFVRFDIVFEESKEPQTVEFRPVGTRVHMILKNWNNPLGTALNTPFQLVTTPKGRVELMMANYSIGEMNHMTLQFWWSGVA